MKSRLNCNFYLVQRIYVSKMLMWIILAVAWIAVLAAGISLYKIAGYAEQKFRQMTERDRRSEDRAA